MAMQSPTVRAEGRASIRVRLSLCIWPQGDAPGEAEFQAFG